MPERVYSNAAVPGKEHIHVEFTAAEIPALLEDLEEFWVSKLNPPTATLIRILREFAEQFPAVAVARSKEQQT